MGTSSILPGCYTTFAMTLKPFIGTSCGAEPFLHCRCGGLRRAMPRNDSRVALVSSLRELARQCGVPRVRDDVGRDKVCDVCASRSSACAGPQHAAERSEVFRATAGCQQVVTLHRVATRGQAQLQRSPCSGREILDVALRRYKSS